MKNCEYWLAPAGKLQYDKRHAVNKDKKSTFQKSDRRQQQIQHFEDEEKAEDSPSQERC